MTIFIFANEAETTLALPASSVDTALYLITGGGMNFPAPIAGQEVVLTLVSAVSSAIREIVYCTNITGDILTVQRAKENTVALNWNAGDFVQNLFTAGTLANFAQINSGTTGQRPVPTLIGQPYYDTTLGYQINCQQIAPSVIWHNGAGNPV